MATTLDGASSVTAPSWEVTPALLGIDAVNLKATPATTTGNIIEVEGFTRFTLCGIITVTGGPADTGDFDLQLQTIAADGSTVLNTTTLIDACINYSDITLCYSWTATGTVREITAASATATASYVPAVSRFIRINCVLNTAHGTATTSTLSCYLLVAA